MRKIIHLDMDAFFAAVEQRDAPELRGKPVVVGGDPGGRGVVATCSYEARRFGIHSAMSAARAYRLCPQAIFVRPRFEAYVQVSRQVRQIFLDSTDLVEPLSLDEAFLDVTENKQQNPSATRLAQLIRQRIVRETGLTASAGVSYNKFLAKVASDVNKPNGLTLVTPEQAPDFIAALPVRRFHGVGRVTEKRMQRLGILTGADLRVRTLEELQLHFGSSGLYYYQIARGIDERPVEPNRVRKSLGKEATLAEDLADPAQMLTLLGRQAEQLAILLKQADTAAHCLTLKVRYADFETLTRSRTQLAPFDSASEMLAVAEELLARTDAGQRAVRLLGISVSQFNQDIPRADPLQLELPFP
ncbi:DNA polymerase IV [Geopsychrobacter electrodiphilus]|uniref:DNA polymerase IV n=1 Tax=Geopsychrobacter electrodiphilus TaxID=225196 RepID=UPI00037A0EA6|nr:DNA polymerase IV [Geopsychrobacter electrodiphilus]